MSQVKESFLRDMTRRVVLEELKSWNLKLVGFISIFGRYFNYGTLDSSVFIRLWKIYRCSARAIHLAFGMGLCFLAYPALKSKEIHL